MISDAELNKNIQFFAKSEIGLKILSELRQEALTIQDLVKRTGITYSSVSSNLNKLQKSEHVEKVGNLYYLRPLSTFYFNTLMDFKTSVEMVADFNDLWAKHNINQLSLESIQNINDLKNSKLIEATPVDIFKTHNTIKKHIIQSKNLKAIFPHLHPEYPGLIENILKKGGNVELILPKNIFKETVFNVNESLRKKAIKTGRLKVYATNNDLRLYLTICDESMSLGLFKTDGSFDQNRILISKDKKAHGWAEELYEYVKNRVI